MEPNKNRVMKKLKTKAEILRTVQSSRKACGVSREARRWWERFVKEVGLEPGVKERGSYGW